MYFNCGELGHMTYNCLKPKKTGPVRKGKEPEKKDKARVFTMGQEDEEQESEEPQNETSQNTTNTMSGMLSFFNIPVLILLDSKATNSFIFVNCILKLRINSCRNYSTRN